jgi:lipopolysaccharide/colanic/teichoic acid biosynthesis glycosyltransferase
MSAGTFTELSTLSPARRLLDVAVSTLALAALAPLLALLAAGVAATSRGPVLFRQVRVGAGGRLFTMYKFRSMRVGTAGPSVTASGDRRVTRIGAFLRQTSLDELPQLFNVLLGDMTLVGPRPEVPDLAERYPPGCRWVFDHRPGMTGPTQIRMRDDVTVPPGIADPEEYYLTTLVPRRVELDATFLTDPTLARTLRLLADTALYLLGHDTA